MRPAAGPPGCLQDRPRTGGPRAVQQSPRGEETRFAQSLAARIFGTDRAPETYSGSPVEASAGARAALALAETTEAGTDPLGRGSWNNAGAHAGPGVITSPRPERRPL